ncbi:MAG: LamG domain-containing protein [Cyclobacteriaceae bacterium]|jgi:hypothetical protein|nr:LamG domain-containing protein [Cyclobacteriaceae bacterium]
MKKFFPFALLLLAVGTAFFVSSCDDEDALPPIDGYNNSNEVAATNLVAHWTFDDTNNERISNTAPSNTYGTVGFTEGQIGKALNLQAGALKFPSIAAIGGANSLPNYTISLWLEAKNTGNSFSTYFGIFPTGNTDFWGNMSVSAETGWFPANGPVGDTLVLKTNYLSNLAGGGTNGQDNRPDPRGNPPVGVFKSAGVWCHVVARWNASTHKLELFGNGKSIGAYNDRGTNTVEMIMRTPCVPMFGSLATTTTGFTNAPTMPDWQVLATAKIDDVRVFNAALSQAEITALYNLGVAKR